MADHPHHPQNPFEPHEDPVHGVGHVVKPKILIATALGLLVLTFLTVTAAKIDFSQMDLKELNIFVALAIAVVKATLVCLFFMHLRWDRPFNAFILVGSLSLVALFISFAMTDTTEYKGEIIGGESQEIQMKLDALMKAEAGAQAAEAHPGGTNPAPAHAGE
jgi:cytochrome c oxidase subunit 4